MGSFSNYLENELLDHVFKTGSYTVPTNIYIALSTTTIEDSTTGTTITEPSGGAYVRKICNTWDAAASGATENTQVVTFAQATKSWGSIQDFAICDAITKGNILVYGNLGAAKTVASGDTAKFATGDIDVTLA